MKPSPTTRLSLERCAQAAGYAAVSMIDDTPDAPRQRPRSGGMSFWRAALTMLFIIA